MAQSESKSRDDEWMGARVSPEFKRYVRMRAGELDMTMSDYLEMLVRDDLEDVEYADV